MTLSIGELTGYVSLDSSGVEQGARRGEAAAARMSASVLADLRRVDAEKAAAKLDADAASAESKITSVRGDLDRLRSQPASAKVDAEVAAAEAKLAGLERTLAGINTKRAELKVTADTAPAEQALDRVESTWKSKATAIGAGAGLAAGGALAAGLGSAINIEQANAKLTAQLGGAGPVAQNAGAAAGALFGRGYSDNMGTVNDAVQAVVTSGAVMRDASSAQLEAVTAKAINLGKAFDQDVSMVAIAAGQAVRNGLGSTDEVFDALSAGLQQAGVHGDDLLESFQEYSPQFSALGLSASEAMGLMNQGLAGGARNADQVADAIKEFSIRAIDGSKTTGEAFTALGMDGDAMAQKIAGGGAGAREGLDQVLDGLLAIEDPVKRDAVAVGLFGTKAEDLKASLGSMNVDTAASSLGQVAGSAEQLGATLEDTAAQKVQGLRNQFDQLTNSLITAPGPIGTTAGALAAFGGGALDAGGNLAMIGLAAGPLLPKLLSVATTAGTAAAGFITSTASMVASAATGAASMVASAARTVGGWALMAGQAAMNAARVIASWALMAAQSVMHAGRAALAWVLLNGASAATAVAGMVANAARVVAQWVLMSVQAMARAAVMAAAWLVAMGPIGWIIAAVVALVALIIANWDTVKAWTISAWQAVSDAVVAAWEWIKSAVTGAIAAVVGFVVNGWERAKSMTSTAWQAVVSLITGVWNTIVSTVQSWIQRAVDFVTQGWERAKSMTSAAWSSLVSTISSFIASAIAWVAGIPGRVMGALGNIGSLLINSGRALVDGFLSGIRGAWDRIVSFVRDGMASLRALWPFSPAKDGPFSGSGYVTHSGKALTGDFAKSLRAGMPGVLDSARAVMAEARGVMDEAIAPTLAGLSTPSLGSLATSAREETLAALRAGRTGDDRSVTVNVHNPLPETASDSLGRRARTVAKLGG